MKCIILAAGYATRLYPLTENFPKPLLAVGGKPILNWLLDDIDAIEAIDEIVVVSNHKFVSHFNAWQAEQHMRCPITILDDGSTDNDHRLGAVCDIQFAIESKSLDDDLLILAGDNILNFSLRGFVDFMISKGTSCVMCHDEQDLQRQQRTAIITLDDNSCITSYEEKPQQPKGHLAVPPFYCYRAADIKRIPEALAQGCNSDAPGSFAAWLSQQTAVHAWLMPGSRYDIGDMRSYEQAQEIFAAK